MTAERRRVVRQGVAFVAQATRFYVRNGRNLVAWSNVSSRTVREDLGPTRWRVFKSDGSPLSGSMRAERWSRLPRA